MVGRVLHPAPALRSAALPFAHIGRVAASLPLPLPRRHGKDGGGGGGEERVVISEVAVRGKDGEPLELPEMEAAAAVALRACRPNAALTVREVQEVVHRVVESGLFRSCMPVAVDTRDSIRLVFEVQPNQDFHGLVCEGANMLPSKFLQEAFRDHHGKIINIRHLDQAIKSVNGWYQECGLTGLVSYAEILSGGILRLRVSKAGVNNINIRFLVVNQLLVRRNQKPYSGNLPPRRGQNHFHLALDDTEVGLANLTNVGLETWLGIDPATGVIVPSLLVLVMTKDKGSPVIRDFYNSQLAASGNAYDDTLVAKLERVYTDSGDHSSTMFVFNIEQGLPILPEWLSFNRVTVRLRQGYEIGPAWLLLSASGGHVKGKFSPHQAFAIGGTNSVRGYEEGAVGSGRSYAVGSGKVSCCMFGPLEGVVFGDYGVLKFLVTQQEPVRSQELVVGTVLASVRTPTGTFATRIRFQ